MEEKTLTVFYKDGSVQAFDVAPEYDEFSPKRPVLLENGGTVWLNSNEVKSASLHPRPQPSDQISDQVANLRISGAGGIDSREGFGQG